MMQQSTRPVSILAASFPKPQTRTHVRCRPQTPRKIRARGFASSSVAQGVNHQGRMPTDLASRMPKQQSMKSRMKNLSNAEMPDDFGFLPKTFVYGPEAADYPSLLSSPQARLRIEWYRLKQATQGLFTTIYMSKWAVSKNPETGRRVRRPLLLRDRAIIARQLHRDFYTALAKGDSTRIPDVACKGVADSAKTQISHRKAEQRPPQKFHIERYSGWNSPRWLLWPLPVFLPFQSTRVLTDRLIPLPIKADSWIRQCVVRIKSTQSLDKGDGSGSKSKELTEYVVIQKLCINGQEKPWKFWGTIKPHSTFQIIDIMEGGFSAGRTFVDMVKEKMSSMSGGML